MEFLTEAMEWIKRETGFQTEKVGRNTYSDKHLARVPYEPECETVVFHSLDGLLDFCKSGIDRDETKPYFLHIESPTKVSLCGELNLDLKRDVIAVAEADLPVDFMDQYHDTDKFIVCLRTRIAGSGAHGSLNESADNDRKILLNIASNVIDDASVKYTDDGLSQQTQINTGIGTSANAIIPDIVTLRPYRTFREISQPSSDYIFRMKKKNDVVSFCLFEADGGAWIEEAVNALEQYCLQSIVEDKNCGNIAVLR